MDDHKDALTDAALEREIESALSVEPSPEFLAKVRSRIAGEPVHAVAFPFWGIGIAGLVMAGAVVLVVSGGDRTPQRTDRADSQTTANAGATSRVSSTPAQPAPVPAQAAASPVIARRAVARAERQIVPNSQARLPAVLIPENEKRGFELLLEELRDKKSAAVMAEAASGRNTPGPPWLEIVPVVIVPLSEFGTVEGGGL